MSDEARAEEAPQQQPGPPIVRRIFYHNVAIGVTPAEGGGKELRFLDPATATEHVIPMSEEHSHKIGGSLSVGGLQVASPQDAAALTQE